MRSRIMPGLGAVLLVGGALLGVAPGATAATTPAPPLTPPTLTKADFYDPWVQLSWNPSSTAGDAKYIDVLADGKQVAQTAAQVDAGAGGQVPSGATQVNVDTSGASPTATYTVEYEDAKGNKSAPSNGLVPTNQQPLPKPVMKSAVISGDKVILTWEPIADNASSVRYDFDSNTNGWGASAKDTTTATVPRTVSFDTGPTGVVTSTLQPGEEVWAQAVDSNGKMSPYGDPVTVTGG
jgi:hypothetical protein